MKHFLIKLQSSKAQYNFLKLKEVTFVLYSNCLSQQLIKL